MLSLGQNDIYEINLLDEDISFYSFPPLQAKCVCLESSPKCGLLNAPYNLFLCSSVMLLMCLKSKVHTAIWEVPLCKSFLCLSKNPGPTQHLHTLLFDGCLHRIPLLMRSMTARNWCQETNSSPCLHVHCGGGAVYKHLPRCRVCTV